MPTLLYYDAKMTAAAQEAVYRVLGQDVRIAADAPDVNQAIADKLAITKAELLALEAEFDNLKAQVASVLTSLDSDEAERSADLASLPLADLATVRQIIGRGLQREARSIMQRRRLIRIVARMLNNFDWIPSLD